MDFDALAADLLARARDLLPQWLPAGRWSGREFVVGNLHGEAGTSLSINSNTGCWCDFADDGSKGGDLIALYAAIHGLSQIDAAKQLANGQYQDTPRAPAARTRKAKPPERRVISPAPFPAPDGAFNHPRFGTPTTVWTYLDASQQLLGHVARYDPAGERKQIVPYTVAEGPNGPAWGGGQWPEPRPLYGLDLLAVAPDAAVLLVEGEKAADAARTLVANRYVVVTWPGGGNAWRKVDWAPLAGRKLLLWPDADTPGLETMLGYWDSHGERHQGIGDVLAPGSPEVKVLDPSDQAPGWDAADALVDGWDWPAFAAWARPRACLLAEATVPARPLVAPVEPIAPTDPSPEPPPLAPHEPAASAAPEVGTEVGTEVPADEPERPAPKFYPWEGKPWAPLMIADGKGIPKPLLANCITALTVDPGWQGVLTYDEFAMTTHATKAPPINGGRIGQWTDYYDIKTAEWLQRVGLLVSPLVAGQAIEAVAHQASFHPVRDYLKACEWDGKHRVERWLIDFLGAQDAPYTRAIGMVFLVGAVARIMQPGCKLDTALILEGSQGKRKSMVFDVLGGAWFSDDVSELGSKDSKMEVSGAWIIELAELSQMNRGDLETTKAFLTRRIDKFRPPYGRRVVERKRQCIFGGTSNNSDYLKDDENRRFLPVRVGAHIDIEGLRLHRDQIWAEAVARFQTGEQWWIQDAALLDVARQQQELRRQADEWENKVKMWLHNNAMTPKEFITLGEFLDEAIGLPSARQGTIEQMRMGRILKVMGWTRRQKRLGVERIYVYYPPDPKDAPAREPGEDRPEDADDWDLKT